MIEDRDYCMSSFLTYRTVIDQTKCFSLKYPPRYTKIPENRVQVHNSDELYKTLKNQVEELCKNHKVALALSGGIDSAVLAKFMPKGSTAYTFQCIVPGKEVTNEVPAAQKYAKECGLNHKVVKIYWEDMEKYAPLLMKQKGAPIHSIEVQIYKAAMQAKADGFDTLLFGESADSLYGGLSMLLSRDWTMGEFIDRFSNVLPHHALMNPQWELEPFKQYTKDGYVDVHGFLSHIFFPESIGSYINAGTAAGVECYMPYAMTEMAVDLDLERVRKGENKYLIREVFESLYLGFVVPPKTPMPRPVNEWFENWEGPKRKEFIPHCQKAMTGNQKWLLWSLETFLNILDEE